MAAQKVTEASLNGFPSSKIEEDPYRFLIVADKFQTSDFFFPPGKRDARRERTPTPHL
jgi:hypothetical protein